MSVTIDSLDIQIRSSAGSAAKNIEELADSLEKLRDKSGLSDITKKLKQINSSLDGISKNSGAAKTLEATAKAAKNSGREFDNATKAAKSHENILFRLADGYQKITEVGSMFRDVWNLAFAQAVEWDGIQFRFGRAFGEEAEGVLEYAEKVSDALKINQQTFMQYSSLYGSLLKGFGVEQEKATTIAVGLTELSYDIWAAHNDQYKTLEDAATAVKSAITGELEPIRNAGVAMSEASMQDYLDSIGMAHVSLEKLTEAQKAEVRYAVMVNAAMNQGIVGTYAREMQTAEGAVRTLKQQLTTLAQAFGSLFIPVLSAVLPYLNAFIDLLVEGIHAIAGFFGVELFKIQWDSGAAGGIGELATEADTASDALGGAAKAAKKLKDYTMGFDELNIISPTSDSASGGGAGGAVDNGWTGLDLDTLWDDAVLASASKQIDEIKAKIKAWFDEWKVELGIISGLFGAIGILNLVKKFAKLLGLSDEFLGTLVRIKDFTKGGIVGTLQYILSVELFDNYIDGEGFKNYLASMFVNALGTGVLRWKFGPTGLVIGLGITAAASLSAVIDNGGITNTESAVTALTGLASALGAVGLILKKTDWGKNFVSGLRMLKDGTLSVKNFLLGITGTAKVSDILTPIGTVLKKAFTQLPRLLVAGIKAIPVWGWIATAIAGVLTLAIVDYDFTDIGYKLGHALGTAFKKVGEWLGAAKDWIEKVCDGVVTGLNKAWEWVKKEFDINNALEGILLLLNPITLITKITPKLIEIGAEVLPGIVEGIKSGWDNFLSNIMEFIDGFVQGWKDALGIHSPSTVFADIGTYLIEGLLNGISNKWQAVKNWFNTTVAPKFTLTYWKTKFETIRTAASEKLEAAKKVISEKWSAIKTWFSDNVAPKFTLDFWLDQFKNLKNGFVTTIKGMVNAGIDMMNRFIGYLNDHLEFSWDSFEIAGKEIVPGGSIQLFTIPKIPRLADGGFVGAGQMFIAREAGPELVGRFGNRTAVANNDQIVAGITAGVYQAVAQAMHESNSGGGQAVNVYLDGKQIYASVKKTEAERGLSLMGSQLGYAY